MSLECNYILSLDENTIQFEIYEQEVGMIPTYLPFKNTTGTALYGRIREDKDYIHNMNFAYGDHGVHIVWDDLENYSVHLLVSRHEWSKFLYLTTLKRVHETQSVDWLKEGF